MSSSLKSKDRGRWPGTNFQEYFPDGICRHQFLGPEIFRKNAMYTKTIYESIDNVNRRYFRLSLNLQATATGLSTLLQEGDL